MSDEESVAVIAQPALIDRSVGEIRGALASYDERRQEVYEWLKSKMKRDIHFGFPPGTRQRDVPGWKHKASLYKAGALLLCDLLQWRPSYRRDRDLWEMIGKTEGAICVVCDLLSFDGCIVGSGTGVCIVGERKTTTPNAANKIAQKRALVDAVLTSLPMAGELFVQDLEDLADEHRVAQKRPTAEQVRTLRDLAEHELLSDDGRRALADMATTAEDGHVSRTKVAATIDRAMRTIHDREHDREPGSDG